MLDPDYEIKVTKDEASYLAIISPISMVLSCFIVTRLMNVWGRKPVVFLSTITQLLTWGLTIYGQSIYVFYAARVINGLSDAVVFGVLMVYLSESVTPSFRSTWGCIILPSFYLGQLLANVIGAEFTIRIAACICISVPFLFGATFMLMPETPYYLIMKGQTDRARKSLQWFRGSKDVEQELFAIQKDVTRQLSERGQFRDLFVNSVNVRALLASLLLRSGQQLCGYTAIVSYNELFLLEADVTLIPPKTGTFIIGGGVLICVSIAVVLVSKIGRRTSFLVSIFGLILSCIVMSLYFAMQQYQIAIFDGYKNIFVANMIVYVILYTLGGGLLPPLMMGELFSISIKPHGVLVNLIANGIFIAIGSQVFYSLMVNFGLYSSFIFFAACTVITFIGSYLILPETNGKTLEEIQQILKNKSVK